MTAAGGWRAPFIGHRAQRVIWAVALAVGASCLLALPYLHFDANTLDLKNPNSESVKTYRDLLAHSKHSPLTLDATRDSLPAARKLAARLGRQPHISGAMTVADYVPAHQDKKLSIISDLALTLAINKPDMSQRADFAARKKALHKFAKAFRNYRQRANGASSPAQDRLQRTLAAWRQWFAAQDGGAQKKILAQLRHRVLSGLPRQVDALAEKMNASRITLSNLPAALKQRWVGTNGVYRVQISPQGNLNKQAVMKAFVASARAVAPHVTGGPVLELDAARTVSQAFMQAFSYAGVVITILLLVLLRSVLDVARVLAPLLLSGLILAAATVWLNIPFNFANVIALPLLLGVGVDSGIHVVYRLRQRRASQAFLATSTARAVVLSSLTTIAGFGSLAFSRHAGTASMGQLLTIGMLAVLVSTLIVVPALFRISRDHRG